ncbi:MAG TPA: hypothetical protein VHP99_01610, partial [Pyrinomonadaceae bacterium]|nr:hypothetical protein [Pyrinomonadaceae bacterium]
MKALRISRLLCCALGLFVCVAYGEANTRLMAQKRVAADKPWQELVSNEGDFRILLPDTPNE